MSKVNEWQHLKIPLKEIEVATENFKTLIGRGGYGWVYKGKLLVSGKETTVAVKRLNEQFGQGLKEFLTEIQLLSGQHHPNIISLVGYCDEGKEKTIVYEYAERGSLDQYIRRSGKSTSTTLTWLQRLKICADAARGLDHLHSHVGSHRKIIHRDIKSSIIHRDIKSSNILIDENWVGKISDLGLSKLSVSGFGMSVIVSNGCGTHGYCEPEYYATGVLTKKSDVYSFGVVLFEVLCGRLCLIDCDDGFRLSSISAKEYYKNNRLDKIIDHSLREHIGSYSMTKFAAIAYRCLHNDREQRPTMDVVAKELEEALRLRYHPDVSKNDDSEIQFQQISEGYDAIAALKKGAYLLKYGRRGKPKFCPFRLANDESILIWFSGKEEKQLRLSRVTRIVSGQRTPTFQRYARPEKEHQSFSLIYSDRSLDVICKDKEEAEVWFSGLKALISRGHQRNWSSHSVSSGGSDSMHGHMRGMGVDAFRVSLSSAVSSSSQGSGHDDGDALGDAFIRVEITGDGGSHRAGGGSSTKVDSLLPKPL